MARIKIKDLPKDMKISAEEMKRVKGGLSFTMSALTGPTDYIKLDGKIASEVDGKIVSNVINPLIGINYEKW